MADRFASQGYLLKNKLGDWIKQLLNSVIAKYRDLSVSRRSDKSRYFAQPRSIIVNYLQLYKCDIEEYKAMHDNRKWGLFSVNMPCCYQIWATPLHMNVNSLLPVDVHPLKRRINFRFRGKLPTYPSPKPSFCPKWEVSVNVNLGEG